MIGGLIILIGSNVFSQVMLPMFPLGWIEKKLTLNNNNSQKENNYQKDNSVDNLDNILILLPKISKRE